MMMKNVGGEGRLPSGTGLASGDARLPKYYRLKERLWAQIDGSPPGTALKPERALSQEFQASRSTVRLALRELAVEGRIVRLQGRGTFVAPPKETLPLQLRSYTEEWQERGRSPGARLLDARVEPAEGTVAQHLGLREDDAVVRLERLRLTDATPMALEVAYLEARRFDTVVAMMQDDVSLYAVLREHFGIAPHAAVETIETVLASPVVADLLDTESGTPMLLLTRTTSDDDGDPFEFVRAIYRGDRYRFVTDLTPP